MSEPSSFEDFLAQQRADYRASLPGRLAALEAAWDAARRDASPAPAWHALERCAHALAGSAATFGLAPIGDAARALETSLEELPGGVPAPESLPAISGHVRDVVALLREATGT